MIGLYFRINSEKLAFERVKNQFDVRLDVGVCDVKKMKGVSLD